MSLFELTIKLYDILAEMEPRTDGFVVLKGSKASQEWNTNNPAHEKTRCLHEELHTSGVLLNNGTNSLFTRNYTFPSAGSAAGVNDGRPTSGPQVWKFKGTDTTYAEWKATNLDTN